MNKTPVHRIKVVSKVFSLLRIFNSDQVELSLAELARQSDQNTVTAFRILKTLVNENILIQDSETTKYRLGFGLVKLGELAKDSNDLLRVSYPHVKELSARWGESTTIDILNSTNMIEAIQYIPSTFKIGINRDYNKPVFPHCAATGKVILADQPIDFLQKFLLRPLPRITPYTLTSPELLLNELDEVRRNGFALNIEEQELGFIAIASPIRDVRGCVVAAVSLGGPASRITSKIIPEIVDSVKQCAQNVS